MAADEVLLFTSAHQGVRRPHGSKHRKKHCATAVPKKIMQFSRVVERSSLQRLGLRCRQQLAVLWKWWLGERLLGDGAERLMCPFCLGCADCFRDHILCCYIHNGARSHRQPADTLLAGRRFGRPKQRRGGRKAAAGRHLTAGLCIGFWPLYSAVRARGSRLLAYRPVGGCLGGTQCAYGPWRKRLLGDCTWHGAPSI